MTQHPFSLACAPAIQSHSGKLIVFEGVQRSGKSTIARRLHQEWPGKHPVHTTEWNSHPDLTAAIERRKQARSFTPQTWFTLHFADFMLRLEEDIQPALRRGDTVFCDRYVHTAIVRDVLKGVPEEYVRACYSVVPPPDALIIFTLSPDSALKRHMAAIQAAGHDLRTWHPYNTGQDIAPQDSDLEAVFRAYRQRENERYAALATETNALLLDGDGDLEENYALARDYVLHRCT